MGEQEHIKGGPLRNYASMITMAQRLTDSAVVVLSLSLMLRLYDHLWSDSYTIAAGAAVITYYFISEANGLYRAWRGQLVLREVSQAVVTWASTVPVLLLLAFLTKNSEVYSRVIVFGWFLVTPTLIVVLRLVVRSVLRELRRRGRNTRSVVVVGMTRSAQKLADQMTDPAAGMRLTGF